MTASAPPRPPRPSDPVEREELEALIEEARDRARRRRLKYGAVGALVALAGVVLFTVFERTAQSQDASRALSARPSPLAGAANSKIVFVRSPRVSPGPQPKKALYIMNPDGSGTRRLTPTAFFSTPAWSPDARKIVFVSGLRGSFDLYVMNADGSQRRMLALNAELFGAPAWSPDGRKIAFVSRGDGNREIYVMNADGSGHRRLTRNTAAPDSGSSVRRTSTSTSPSSGSEGIAGRLEIVR